MPGLASGGLATRRPLMEIPGYVTSSTSAVNSRNCPCDVFGDGVCHDGGLYLLSTPSALLCNYSSFYVFGAGPLIFYLANSPVETNVLRNDAEIDFGGELVSDSATDLTSYWRSISVTVWMTYSESVSAGFCWYAFESDVIVASTIDEIHA